MDEPPDSDQFRTGAGLDILNSVADRGDQMLGQVLGEYRIEELIAEGGMSHVYRGQRIDGTFDRDVAIKISLRSAMSADLRSRFTRELRILAELNHPNISQLYDAGITDEGWPYIVRALSRVRQG